MLINEVVENQLPNEPLYLIDFYATWCNPCKMLSKVLEDLESDVPVYKVNIEENMELARKFNIRGVPALVVMKEDDNVAQKAGFMTEAELLAFIESHR